MAIGILLDALLAGMRGYSFLEEDRFEDKMDDILWLSFCVTRFT